MPNTASAKKRLKQNVERRSRNRAVKSLLRKRLRTVRETVATGDTARIGEEFRTTARQLDRAAARGVIHPNSAARLKSRLQTLIKKSTKA